MKVFKLFSALTALVLALHLASAVTLNSVFVDEFAPGSEGTINIEIENILSDDVQDVSLSLNTGSLPFIVIGSSEQSVEEIEEDDDEEFLFRLKASTEIEPGQYEIPYTLNYKINDKEKTREGTIGVRVVANPELAFSISATNPIIGQKGQVSLKIINKGFFDARFVSVKILPDGLEVLSDSEVYIGTIDSDDFDSSNFDVLFKKANAQFSAIVTYRDFDNEQIIKQVNLPIKAYSPEQAVQLGLISKNQTGTYLLIAAALIVLILLWRWRKKRQRLKRSMQNKG